MELLSAPVRIIRIAGRLTATQPAVGA